LTWDLSPTEEILLMIVIQDGFLLMNLVKKIWSQNIWFNYSGERLRYDSNGNQIDGNTGQWQLTAEQVKGLS
jgi:hypothetical protein